MCRIDFWGSAVLDFPPKRRLEIWPSQHLLFSNQFAVLGFRGHNQNIVCCLDHFLYHQKPPPKYGLFNNQRHHTFLVKNHRSPSSCGAKCFVGHHNESVDGGLFSTLHCHCCGLAHRNAKIVHLLNGDLCVSTKNL